MGFLRSGRRTLESRRSFSLAAFGNELQQIGHRLRAGNSPLSSQLVTALKQLIRHGGRRGRRSAKTAAELDELVAFVHGVSMG